MDAYIYSAALWCEECIDGLKEKLTANGVTDTGDSDDWPQGPYADGGGEADAPQHCDGCWVFLENPLTSEGVEYVKERLAEHFKTGVGDGNVLADWSEFYDMSLSDLLRDV